MTEDDKFREVFDDMRAHPERYAVESTGGGTLYVGHSVMLSYSAAYGNWSISPRGIAGTGSIPVPRHLKNEAVEAAAVVEESKRALTRSLPSFLNPRRP